MSNDEVQLQPPRRSNHALTGTPLEAVEVVKSRQVAILAAATFAGVAWFIWAGRHMAECQHQNAPGGGLGQWFVHDSYIRQSVTEFPA